MHHLQLSVQIVFVLVPPLALDCDGGLQLLLENIIKIENTLRAKNCEGMNAFLNELKQVLKEP